MKPVSSSPRPGRCCGTTRLLGAEHVLGGLDHMLFLLVVLATGWGWRHTALALTVFTAGHAISLAAVAIGGFSAPAHIVEPAIAATIVGMALFDRWSHARSQPLAPAWRLALVFGCALIHGLGLAGALTRLGLDSTNRLLSLVGFNAGIEAAQLGVALAGGRSCHRHSTLAWPRRAGPGDAHGVDLGHRGRLGLAGPARDLGLAAWRRCRLPIALHFNPTNC